MTLKSIYFYRFSYIMFFNSSRERIFFFLILNTNEQFHGNMVFISFKKYCYKPIFYNYMIQS